MSAIPGRISKLIAVLSFAAARLAFAQAQAPDADATIRFYEQKLADHPTLFAGHAALGAAYLDKARETHDVAWLGKGRAALTRSLEIQPSFNALATMAALCNFSHRFACALEFADRAARIAPGEESLVSLRAEAYLGLGKLDEAAQLIHPDAPREGATFTILAARGRWFAEQKRFDEALECFMAAAAKGRELHNDDLAIWAETNAAGMLLDSQRPGPARPHLEAASALKASRWPTEAVLLVHWAELNDLEGKPAEGLAHYSAILQRQADPEIFRRAFVLAKKLERESQAQSLFADGERAAERIRAAGEIFALESQARLYADAGVKLPRALELARENMTHKQDRSARETLAYVQLRAAETR